jgi:hypothetical protein
LVVALTFAGAAVAAGCGGRAVPAPDAGGAAEPDTGPDGTTARLASCEPGAELTGASYDVAKSRFAFGSTPVVQPEVNLTRWVGADGALAIFSNGDEGAGLNGGAPESVLPSWSNDPAALGQHVREYFISMGVAPCQIAAPQVMGGTSGIGISLERSVDGIFVGESLAFADFDVDDQTTDEGFYWPTIGADVVSAARAFRDRLADPAGLAAYQALLPAEAQGPGRVLIRHTEGVSTMTPFLAAAVYDVFEPNPAGKGSNHDFDAEGHEVTQLW